MPASHTYWMKYDVTASASAAMMNHIRFTETYCFAQYSDDVAALDDIITRITDLALPSQPQTGGGVGQSERLRPIPLHQQCWDLQELGPAAPGGRGKETGRQIYTQPSE